jgi:hypothetical protein
MAEVQMNKLSDRLYAWTVALILAALMVGCVHVAISQEKVTIDTAATVRQFADKKFKVKPYVDSVLTPKATWDVDTILVKGDKSCDHQWLTEFENQKYQDAPDSLQTILNPNHERVVQEQCVLCGRERIKSETITFVWKKKQ